MLYRSLCQSCAWAGVAWSLSWGSAVAEHPRRVTIPAQPMTSAILQLGVQAGISIGAGPAATCGRSRAVRGAIGAEAALRVMLAGSPCTYRRIDAHSYLIIRRPAPPAPVTRPATPPPPDSSEISPLDDIVVTATKQDLLLAGAPYALSAVAGETLDAASRPDTAALSTRLAGLTVTNLGPGRNKLFVRGLADSPLTGQTQAMVGLYLDDTRLTYDAPDPDLRLVDLDRVELLRGPQATLYGAGTLGGVLKLVSRAPVLDARSAELTAGLTFAADAAPGQSLDLTLNLPIVRDRLALRAVFYEETLEGVVDDPALGLINTGNSLRSGARAGLLWRINSTWQARLGTVFQNLHIDDSQYAFETLPAYQRTLSVREPSNNDFNGVSLSLVGDHDWGEVKVTSAFQGHDLDRRYDATAASLRLGAGGRPLAYDEADGIRAFALEASVTRRSDGAFQGFAGLYASHYGHDRTGRLVDLERSADLYIATKRDETDEAAIFGEIAWTPVDRLRLIAGGRYFVMTTISETDALAQNGADLFEGELRDDGISSKLVVEYEVTPQIFVYVQASEGYRSGGFNGGALGGQRFDLPGGQQPYREYRPDSLFSYEAGLRWRLLNDRLSLRAAIFSIDWTSIQSDRVSPDGLPFTANIGDGGNRGIEIEGVWRDGPWRLDVNFMGNNPHLSATDDGYPLATDNNLPGVPKVLGAASLRYTGSVFGRRSWFSGSIGYVGRSSQQLTPQTTSAMGDYFSSEAAVGIDMGAWSATVRIDNLLGQAGDTFGYGNPFLVGVETVITPQRPRNLSISMSRAF